MPIPGLGAADPAGSAARIVQTALTPVFLLSGIGTLISLFNTRLARVSDQIAQVGALIDAETEADQRGLLERHQTRLRWRLFTLDASVALGALGGAATCGSVFVLFLGDVKGFAIDAWLITISGGALGCTIASLVAFLIDSLLVWWGFKTEGPIPHARKDKAPS